MCSFWRWTEITKSCGVANIQETLVASIAITIVQNLGCKSPYDENIQSTLTCNNDNIYIYIYVYLFIYILIETVRPKAAYVHMIYEIGLDCCNQNLTLTGMDTTHLDILVPNYGILYDLI